MSETSMMLPIRLVPRRGMQAYLLAISAAFAGFAIYWTATEFVESRRYATDGAEGLDFWLNYLPPLVGAAFFLIGVGGMIRSVLKLLPGSPCYHLSLYPEGLVVSAPFRRRRFTWAEMPAFETIAVQRRSKYGARFVHYTVAKAAIDGGGHPRELLRVHADEYGGKKSQEDADALTAWLNSLRERGSDGRLKNGDAVEIPEGFRATATPLTPRQLQRAEAAVLGRQKTAAQAERPPTVRRL